MHRIGRTGRAGKEGIAQSIVTPDELKSLKDIEKMLGEDVVWIGEPPSEQDFEGAGKRRRVAAGVARLHGRARSAIVGVANADAARVDGARATSQGQPRRSRSASRSIRSGRRAAIVTAEPKVRAPREDKREQRRSEPRRDGARAWKCRQRRRGRRSPPSPRLGAERTAGSAGRLVAARPQREAEPTKAAVEPSPATCRHS